MFALLAICGCKSGESHDVSPLGPADDRSPCLSGGIEFPVGSEFPTLDDCNSCTCNGGKTAVFCTLVYCPHPPTGCIVNEVMYDDGASNVPDPNSCNCCSCIGGQITRCSTESCARPPACKYGEAYYQDGHGFATRDGDFSCTCRAGAFSCGPSSPRAVSDASSEVTAPCKLPEGLSGPEPALLLPSPQPLRAAEFSPPSEIDSRGLDQDLSLIWQLRHALPPRSSVRAWLHGIPGISREQPLELGYGLERIDAGLLGHYGTCDVRILLIHDELSELRVECSFDEWRLLENTLRTALGPAFEITSDADRGRATLRLNSQRMQGVARTTLDAALGPVLDAPVPPKLTVAYELLSSPFSRLVIGTACANGIAPLGRPETLALAFAKRFDLLRNVLSGSNPEARIYAAWALDQAKAFTWRDRLIAEHVRHSALEVMTCSGAWKGPATSEVAAAGLEAR
ncbi:MAG TPA: hypothetical protein VGM44_08565 [Polyangiaceae bacterium]